MYSLKFKLKPSIGLFIIFSGFLLSACDPMTGARGTVKDNAGKPIEGVAVVLESLNGKESTEQITEADGKYDLVTVGGSARELKVVFRKTGFQMQEIKIESNKRNQIDAVLNPETK